MEKWWIKQMLVVVKQINKSTSSKWNFCICIFYIIVVIAQISKECYLLSGIINNNINKKLEEQVKQLPRKIQKLEKENEYQQKEIMLLHQKTNFNFVHCKLQPDNVCDHVYAGMMKKY